MADEKDRFGDKLRDKERAEEDSYFNQREKALLEKLKQKAAAGVEPGSMRCPRDGAALVAVDHRGVTAEECPTCGGVWLEKGELETVAKREKDSWLGRLVYGPRE